MKKIFCLLLALLFTILLTTIAFAAQEDLLEPTTPENVGEAQYGELFDEDIPESGPPLGDPSMILPQTGGVPPVVFYAAGGICIVSAVIILTRKRNESAR